MCTHQSLNNCVRVVPGVTAIGCNIKCTTSVAAIQLECLMTISETQKIVAEGNTELAS